MIRPVRLVLVAVLALATLSASPGTAVISEGRGESWDYVALGDSYTAGPLIPTNVGGGCVRSTHNYPALLAADLAVASFTDVSCSGARSRDLRRQQTVFGGGTVPPQLDALSAETDLVTLGMGGNDFGLFGSIVSTCPTVRDRDPDGKPCQRTFTRTVRGERVDTKARDARRIQARLERSLDLVADRAPAAEVLVVGYPRLLPTSGTCEAVPFAAGDYEWARKIQRLLNRSLRLAAESRGATYVDTSAASLGHDACAGDDAWVNGSVMDWSRAAAYHPFAEGMAGVAAVVEAALAVGEWSRDGCCATSSTTDQPGG